MPTVRFSGSDGSAVERTIAVEAGGGIEAVVPGTGAVLFSEDFDRADLEDMWQYTTPHRCSHCSNEGDAPPDPWIERRSDNPSPYLPVGWGPNEIYARFKAEPDVQSLYDRDVANNDATRSALIKGYRYQGGHTVTYLDVRRMPGASQAFPFDIAGGGATRSTPSSYS